MSRKFNRYMLEVGVGTNRKLRRLPVAQRWAYVAGVLSLAAQSPLRGALLIADGEPVTDADVAEEATIPVKDARAALASLRRLGMLDKDEHGVEWVHDWDSLNPEPKPSDSPEATRARKRRQRAESRPGHADVTRDTPGESRESHAPEVEEEEEALRTTSSENDRVTVTYQRERVPDDVVTNAKTLLTTFNHHAGRDLGMVTASGKASPALKQIIGALLARPEVTVPDWGAAIVNQIANPPSWIEGPVQLGHIFGEKAADHALANTGEPAESNDPDRVRRARRGAALERLMGAPA